MAPLPSSYTSIQTTFRFYQQDRSFSHYPPSPSFAVSYAPLSPGIPGNKVKLIFNSKDLLIMEEKRVHATAPPLFLEPVNGSEEVELLFGRV
jgi:hypothetical protein